MNPPNFVGDLRVECMTCAWFVSQVENKNFNPGTGECRRYPPVLHYFDTEGSYGYQFVITKEEWNCAEWRMRRNA